MKLVSVDKFVPGVKSMMPIGSAMQAVAGKGVNDGT